MLQTGPYPAIINSYPDRRDLQVTGQDASRIIIGGTSSSYVREPSSCFRLRGSTSLHHPNKRKAKSLAANIPFSQLWYQRAGAWRSAARAGPCREIQTLDR